MSRALSVAEAIAFADLHCGRPRLRKTSPSPSQAVSKGGSPPHGFAMTAAHVCVRGECAAREIASHASAVR